MGQITAIVVTSPTMAKEIFRDQEQLFCNRPIPDALRVVAADSLPWMPISPKWRYLRKICTSQLFASRVLEANQGKRRAKVQELIASVNDSMVRGLPVDIGKAAFRATLNLLSRTIFSVDLADDDSRSNGEMSTEFKKNATGMLEETAKPNLRDYFPVLRKIDPQGRRRNFTIYHNKMLSLFESLISQRLECRKGDAYVTSNDMLDTLINLIEENTEEYLNNPKVVVYLLMALFVAGAESSSVTLEWAMAKLLHNRKCLSEAKKELEE